MNKLILIFFVLLSISCTSTKTITNERKESDKKSTNNSEKKIDKQLPKTNNQTELRFDR